MVEKYKIEMRRTDSIKPYERNPRRNDAAVDAVARSIRKFGFRQPIVVDADGIIIVGHARWKAAKKLGMERVPVHVATDLTEEQRKAYRVADNRTNEFSEWDWEILLKDFSAGFLKDMDFDLGELLSPAEMQRTEILPPPELVWILIKTTPEKFARIADYIERLPEDGQEVFITYTGEDDGKKR